MSCTIIGVAAQRLVRVLCSHCKNLEKTDHATRNMLGVEKELLELYRPVGCDQCGQTGYQGRTGIYEVIIVDEKLKAMIHANESESEMQDHVRESTDSMRSDGFRKVLLGETTLEEVLRVSEN